MGQIIKIKCNCGELLFKYFKDKKGKLIKCYLDEIREDYVGGVREMKDGDIPKCPKCGKELGVITMVHGRPALKIKQSTISMRT